MNRKMGKLGFGMTVIALVVCLVIVTGSTFSLFTTKDQDDISITAANVELIAKIDEASLALYSKGVAQTGKFENGGTATFTNKNHTLTFENIAPGDKATFNIVVTNNSTIDIQYRIKWTYEGELGEALVATVDGKTLASGDPSEWAKWTPEQDNTKILKLAFELPITEGNEWQNKSASISFYIEAVQANGTFDYEAFVNTANGLQAAIDSGAKTITLTDDIELDAPITIGEADNGAAPRAARRNAQSETTENDDDTIKINLNGKTIKSNVAEGAAIVNYADVVITNGTVEAANGVAFENNATAKIEKVELTGTVASVGTDATLTLTESEITVSGDAPAISATNGGAVVVESGTYTNDSEDGVVISGNVTVENGNFEGTIESEKDENGAVVAAPVISGGNFSEVPEDAEVNGNFVVDLEGNNTVVPEGVEESDVYILNLKQLLKFAESVNAGNTYQGKKVALVCDIDLANVDWTPIGNASTSFNGHFNGYNHTISNLVAGAAGKSNIGFFGFTQNGSVKNINFNNAKVTGRLNVGVVSGTPYTSEFDNITITGHVEVNGLAYVGGALGKNAYANVSNITINADETSYVKAYSIENGNAYRTYVGGVIGFMGEGAHTVSNIKSNIDVYGSTCDVGGIVGIAHYGNTFENIVCTGNVYVTDAAEASEAEEMGGIAGVWNNESGYTVTFIDCVFEGALNANFTEGVDLSDNTVTGAAYSANGTGTLVIKNYFDINGVTYLKDAVNDVLTLYLVPEEYTGDTVVVVEGTYAIGNYAFAYNDNVKTVILASTVRNLGRGFDSSSVEKVVLNEGLEVISSRAFRSTSALKEVVFSSTVKVIEDNAFQKSSIKEIVIPASVITIGETAFGASLIEKITFEGNTDIQGYAFRGCTKLNTVVLNGLNVNFVKSTLNGRNSCWFCNGESNNPGTSNITFYVKTETIKDRVLTAMGAEKNNTPVIVEMTSENGYNVDANGVAYVYTADQLVAALEAKRDVLFCNDIKIEPANMGNAYGTTGINVKYGQTIDGNGYTLDIKGAGGTWDSGINTTGGVIKNLTVTGSFRGIFVNHTSTYSEKVVLENVTITGVIYTISCDQGMYQTLEATNCTFNGWTSFAETLGEAKFVNCNFGEGNGYAYCRPYSNTEFVNCTFSEGYEVDTTRATVTFTGCGCN